MPEPRSPGRYRGATALAVGVAVALVATQYARPSLAAPDKQLQRVKGSVQFGVDQNAPKTNVIGKILVDDNAEAYTAAKSAATLTMPDSSIIGIGENTDVNIGAFSSGTQGPGSTITIKNGTLRFDVRRPTGATANYHFSTPTTQVAVRGTVGLVSLLNGNMTIACLACAADSVTLTITTTGQTLTLLTGQFITVSITGAVVTGVVSASVLGGFSAAGVSTSASSGAAAATAGVAGSAGAITGTTAAIAGGAAAAAAAGAVLSTQGTPKPQESQDNAGSAGGSISLTGAQRPVSGGTPVARPVPPPATGPGRR